MGPSQDTHWILFQLLIRGFAMNLQRVSRSQVIGYCIITALTKLCKSSPRKDSSITYVCLSVILLPEFLMISQDLSLILISQLSSFSACQNYCYKTSEYSMCCSSFLLHKIGDNSVALLDFLMESYGNKRLKSPQV